MEVFYHRIFDKLLLSLAHDVTAFYISGLAPKVTIKQLGR